MNYVDSVSACIMYSGFWISVYPFESTRRHKNHSDNGRLLRRGLALTSGGTGEGVTKEVVEIHAVEKIN